MKTFDAFQKEVGEWGNQTFPSATIETIAKHFAEEGEEFIQAVFHPLDGKGGQAEWWEQADEEAADCLMLLLHYAHRRGVSLLEVAEKKFAEIQTRTWDDGAERGYSKHIEAAP